MRIKILIGFLKFKSVVIEGLTEETTIDNIKSIVDYQSQVDTSKFSVYYNDKLLSNKDTIASVGIQENDKLTIK